MPKIIENLPELLAAEARKQVEEAGYGALTVRSVAKACGVGVGTVYNYYPSKEALVASFMLSDWKVCVAAMEQSSEKAEALSAVLQTVHQQLLYFIDLHSRIFRDNAAMQGFTGSLSRYHNLLRSQLAAPIRKFCPDDFTAEFIAEALLTWTIAGKSFGELESIIKKLV